MASRSANGSLDRSQGPVRSGSIPPAGNSPKIADGPVPNRPVASTNTRSFNKWNGGQFRLNLEAVMEI